MKTLKVIKAIIGITAILMIVGVVIAIVVFMTLPEGKIVNIGEPHLEITSTELSEGINNILPKFDSQAKIEAKAFELKIPVTLSLRILVIGMVLFLSLYVGYLIETFRRLIIDIEHNISFNYKNIRRVKLIGILITSAPIFEWLFNLIFSWWLSGKVESDSFKIVFESGLGWPVFLLGLLIIVLGVAFEQGKKIQEENELTI